MKEGGQQLELIPEQGIVCPKCGGVSPNEYLDNLNHKEMPGDGLCGSQSLVRNQIRYLSSNGTPEALADRVQYGRDLRLDVDSIMNQSLEKEKV